MKEKEMQDSWKDYSTRLESDLNLNHSTLNMAKLKSTRLTLWHLMFRRFIEATIFIILLIWLLRFASNNYPIPQFALSGIILALFCLVGFIGSTGQIILIIRLDYSKPVTTFQLQIEKLKAYSLQTLKLLLLSIPFYFAYIIIGFKAVFNFDIYSQSSINWLLWNLILSILFIPFSIWLYKKLNYKTKNRWLKSLIADNGGKQISSAVQFINEIEELKKQI